MSEYKDISKLGIYKYRNMFLMDENGTLHQTMAVLSKDLQELPTADVVPRAEYEKVVINMNAYGLTAKRLQEDIERLQEINERQVEDIRLAKADVARAFRQRMNEKMGKHTHLLGKEYVQRLLREVEKEMEGGAK